MISLIQLSTQSIKSYFNNLTILMVKSFFKTLNIKIHEYLIRTKNNFSHEIELFKKKISRVNLL